MVDNIVPSLEKSFCDPKIEYSECLVMYALSYRLGICVKSAKYMYIHVYVVGLVVAHTIMRQICGHPEN